MTEFNVDEWLPSRGRLIVKRMAEPEPPDGAVVLPETVEQPSDAFYVMAAGRETMLRPGDLVVTEPGSLDFVDEQHAFVSESKVAAYRQFNRRGGWLPWVPTEQNVLLRPVRTLTVDPETKATVVAGATGAVLTAAGSSYGMTPREWERGQELYDELRAIVRSKEYQAQPSAFYQHRMIHQRMDSLCAWERHAVYSYQEALEEDKVPDTKPMRPIRRRYFYRKGVVVAGPAELIPGAHVWFDKEYRYMFIGQGADENHSGEALIVVDRKWLAAVEA